MQHSNPVRTLLLALLTTAALSWTPRKAAASEKFPAALQQAAGMPCTPSCAVCHGVTPGTITTFQDRKLGKTLFTINGPLAPNNTAQLQAAYGVYAAKPENAAAVTALKAGVDPETGTGLCGPTYGCAMHGAKKAPERDLSAPLLALGAMVVGGLVRRRRKAAK